jgi:hypothetical protein
MCACEAYRFARKFGIELPDWIVTWLDRGFEDFWAKATCEGETVLENSRVALKMLPANCPRPTQAFAKAFGVKDSAWRKYYPTFWRFFGQQVELAAWEDHQAGKPIKEIAIISSLAEEWAVSSATAWRIWARFKKCYPENVAWMPSQARGRRRRRGA